MSLIEVKLGSPTVTDERGMSHAKVSHAAEGVVGLIEEGHEVVVTSSGAIATGRAMYLQRLKERLVRQGKEFEPFEETDEHKRSYASIGSAPAYMAWQIALNSLGYEAGQVLVTSREIQDLEEGAACLELLRHNLSLGIVSVINGNDATSREGVDDIAHSRDNDLVAARIAQHLPVDVLCYLTDVDGLMDGNGEVVSVVEEKDLSAAYGLIHDDGNGESGGMRSKVTQANMVAGAGISAHIANAAASLSAVVAGESGTYFPAR